jgi:hypothetical protein
MTADDGDPVSWSFSLHTSFYPPFRFELFGVGTPESFGPVDRADWNRDHLAGGNRDAVDSLVICCLDRDTKWYYIILRGLVTH